MNKEIWKNIEEYENYYQVSNYGKVKSLKRIIIRSDNKPYLQKEQLLKPGKTKKGYLQVVLTKEFKTKPCRVHRLVAQAFIPNPNNLPQVNHIDGNKENNNVSNLEWVSNYDNMQHSIKTGLRDIKKITNILYESNRRPIIQYDINGNFIKKWNSIKDVEVQLNIPNQNIIKVCQNKRHTAGGYKWEYAQKQCE